MIVPLSKPTMSHQKLMAHARSQNFYELMVNMEVKASMMYKSMFSNTAEIQILQDTMYTVKSVLSWKPRFKITADERDPYYLEMNIKGDSNLLMQNGLCYQIGSKGFLVKRYFVKEPMNNWQMEITPRFVWTRIRFDYEFPKDNRPEHQLVCLIAVYAFNFQRQRMMGIAFICFSIFFNIMQYS